MMNRLLALTLALVPGLAFAEVNTCSLSNNRNLEDQYNSRSFDGFFNASGNQIKTLVTFRGSSGNFTRQGLNKPDSLNCVRYLTVEEAIELALERNAPGLDASSYFDTSLCGAIILADWVAGNSRGRVLWCASSYASGADVKGIYWQDTDWQKDKFTDLWEGRWK